MEILVFVGNNEGFLSHSLSTRLIVIPCACIDELGGFDAQESVSRKTELLQIGFQSASENLVSVESAA